MQRTTDSFFWKTKFVSFFPEALYAEIASNHRHTQADADWKVQCQIYLKKSLENLPSSLSSNLLKFFMDDDSNFVCHLTRKELLKKYYFYFWETQPHAQQNKQVAVKKGHKKRLIDFLLKYKAYQDYLSRFFYIRGMEEIKKEKTNDSITMALAKLEWVIICQRSLVDLKMVAQEKILANSCYFTLCCEAIKLNLFEQAEYILIELIGDEYIARDVASATEWSSRRLFYAICYAAAKKANVDFFELILSKLKKYKTSTYDWFNLLNIAIAHNQLANVKLLIREFNYDLNKVKLSVDEAGICSLRENIDRSALLFACQHGELKIVKYLVEANRQMDADLIKTVSYKKLSSPLSVTFEGFIKLCAQHPRSSYVLYSYKADKEFTYYYEGKSLEVFLKIMTYLISQGADVNYVADYDQTILTRLLIAMTEEQLLKQTYFDYAWKSLTLLVGHGAVFDPKQQRIETLLHMAMEANRFELVKFLVSNKVNVNCKPSRIWGQFTVAHPDQTILQRAGKNQEMIDFLLAHGAAIEIQFDQTQVIERFVVTGVRETYKGREENSIFQPPENSFLQTTSKTTASLKPNVNST